MNCKSNESPQKLRGGYYTPLALAQYLASWIAEICPKRVFEPSCGDGVFLQALVPHLPKDAKVTAIEIDQQEAKKASHRIQGHNFSADIICANFLGWYLNEGNAGVRFDAVVGNPPFVRYQYLSEADQEFSERIFRRHNLPFTRHVNAWVPFVLGTLALLRPSGRFAMVLPAEILHVLHAQTLRYFLIQHCRRIMIFDPEEIWFSGTLQGAVLLLAEKKAHVRDSCKGIAIHRTNGKSFLESAPSQHFKNADFITPEALGRKWTKALLTKRERDTFDTAVARRSVHRFERIAEVDVGLVTGANRFFLVNDAVVREYGLAKWSYPMFGRSEHCPGVLYDERQHRRNATQGLPSNFLWFNVDDPSELSDQAAEYIRLGERKNFHTRYKCRVRKPWFKVPSVYATPIGMLKRAHDMPRLIYNQAGAYTTDTAYRIRVEGINAKKLVYCFVNSLTALSSELEGRHYGGGVLELVPSEIEKLHVPLPPLDRVEIAKLDKFIREACAGDVLAYQDERILTPLGLTTQDISCIHHSWNKLRSRRQRLQSSAQAL